MASSDPCVCPPSRARCEIPPWTASTSVLWELCSPSVTALPSAQSQKIVIFSLIHPPLMNESSAPIVIQTLSAPFQAQQVGQMVPAPPVQDSLGVPCPAHLYFQTLRSLLRWQRQHSHLLLASSAFTARFFPGSVTSAGCRQGCEHSAQLLLWIHGQLWLCITYLAAEAVRCHPAALGSFTSYCSAPSFLTAPAQQLCVPPSRAWLTFSKAPPFCSPRGTIL